MRNRLLIFSVLCVAGTVNSALLGGATGLLVGLGSNILAADLGLIWDKFGRRLVGRDAVLQNADLSQAVGNAVAAVIAKASRLEQYRDYRAPLQRLASRAASGWTELAQLPEFTVDGGLDPVREVNLAQLFSVKPSEFAQAKALTPPEWAQVLNTWQQQEQEFIRDPQVMGEIAEMLHQQFPKALREVLKEDFATGGRAFAGLMLDLVGDLRGALQEQHEAVLGRLDELGGVGVDRSSLAQNFQRVTERLDALSVGDGAAFQTLSGQIESGFENIAQLLAELGIQLAGAEERILKHQAEGFQRIEDRLDGWNKPITVSVVIDTSRPKVSHWQGRTEELTTLRHQLERVSLVGIPGLGGYGKSALANQLYETSDYPTKIWVTMSQLYRFSELGRWLLGKFGLQVEEQVDDEALATALTNCLTEQRSLVVLDNLETLLDGHGQWRLPGYEAFLLKWLEYGRTSTILVTSREQPRLPLGNSYWYPTLTGLKVAEGAALLRDYGVVGDEATMQAFVVLADGHPLLLGLAAALLQDELGENPDIAGLKIPGLNLFKIVGLHRGDPEVSVNKLFTASFGRLEERLQQLLCCVSVYRLPFNAAAAAVMLKETALTWQEPVTQQQIEQDLRHLAKRSLLQEAKRTTGTERRFQFLPLIASYVQRQESNWTWAHERAIFFYRSTAKPTSWGTDEDLREYFEAFHHHCELRQFALAYGVLDLCNSFLSLRGYNRAIVQLYRQLVEGWQSSSSANWSDFSWALTNLGNAYRSLGKYAQAIDCHKQSLTITRNIGDQKGEAASLGNLGNAYSALGQYPRAIEFYEQLLEIFTEIRYYKSEAASLSNLGNAYYALGQYHKAINFCKKSLVIQCKINDRNGEAASLNNLGNAYCALDNHQQAIALSEQSLAIQREIGDRDGEALSIMNLGNAYCALGYHQQAIDLFEQSLAIQREIGDRNGEALSIKNLGNAYCALGHHQQAIALSEQSLAIQREIGNRYGEANSLAILGNIRCLLRQYKQAISLYEKSSVIQREIGNQNGEANSFIGMGNAYSLLSQYPQSVGFYEKSLEIQRITGDRNGEARSLMGLGSAYGFLRKYDWAIDSYEQSLKISREIGDHCSEANTWFNLGITLAKVDRVPDALGAYRNARELYADMELGSDVQDCDNAIQQLSSVPDPPRPKFRNLWVRLWQWFKQLVRSLLH
jgi:tetratricopeptide (TPR) repeat protein